MTHDEHHMAAATLTGELAATRKGVEAVNTFFAALKDRIATALTARGPFAVAEKDSDPDIFDDLYYPEALTRSVRG